MKDKLNKYAQNITSQYGEDGILDYIIKNSVGEIAKIACEFGAWDGKFLSNIYNLWHDNEWDGILIESDKTKFKSLKETYDSYKNVNCYNYFVEPNGTNSLDNIFKINNLPLDIGVLSIDIDSVDYYIWNYLKRVNPQIVVIEYNNTIPPYIEYTDPEETCFLRCSIKALETLGIQKGYKLLCCTVTNAIFIKNELFNNEQFPDMPAEYLFDYEGQRKNGPLEATIVGAQFITSYPIFTSKPSIPIKFYYSLKKLGARFLKKGPKRISPTTEVKKQLMKAGLYFSVFG